ncbi:MAG: hypothetical protein ACUVQY_02435 [Thermoproteota archaeon]
MVGKPLKAMLLTSLLLLGILVIYASLMSIAAQTDTSSGTSECGSKILGPLGHFGWSWSLNFSKPAQIRPYHNRFELGWGPVEVSEEFKDNVFNIAKSDPDVQELLSEGYNITSIKPIITTTVEADGSVVTKAKSGILMLRKNNSGVAFVWVDVEKGKVTRIEIITRTVIEKP